MLIPTVNYLQVLDIPTTVKRNKRYKKSRQNNPWKPRRLNYIPNNYYRPKMINSSSNGITLVVAKCNRTVSKNYTYN